MFKERFFIYQEKGDFEAEKLKEQAAKENTKEKVSWKYADAEKAKKLKAENPNDKLQDNEIEKAADNVSWMEEWKGTELDDQWKDKKFRDAIVKNVLENRAKKKEDAKRKWKN